MSKELSTKGRSAGSFSSAMGISGRAVLCVEALAAITAEDGVLSAKDIGKAIGVDRTAAINCMACLRGSGIVISEYKKNGGYRLVVDPDSLSVLDVIRIVDGDKHGSIFSEDIASSIKTLLREMLEIMSLKEVVLEFKLSRS